MANAWPVNLQGILLRGHQVLLVKNDRQQWELPGGRADEEESLEKALARQCHKQTGLTVQVGTITAVDLFRPSMDKPQVLLLFYPLSEADATQVITLSDPYVAYLWASLDDLSNLGVPDIYGQAVSRVMPSHTLSMRVLGHVRKRLSSDEDEQRMQRMTTAPLLWPQIGLKGVRGTDDDNRRELLLARSNLGEMHQAFVQGTLSPVAVIENSLELAKRWQRKTPIFITLSETAALASARLSEERYRQGRPLSTMDGIAIGLKDLIDVRGQPTTAASAWRLGEVAHQDAAVVTTLRRHGLNVEFGKLNLHEYAYGPTGNSSYFGAVANPYDLARMAGGSSSGCAVAVATGILPLAIGTDTGGSIRIPAALTGISGFKPTYGSMSLRGVVPLSWSLDHIGPMARRVSDLSLAWEAMGGLAPLAHRGSPSVRLFWPEDQRLRCDDAALEDYLQKAMQTIVDAFAYDVVRGPLPDLDTIWVAQSILIGAEALAYHYNQLRASPQRYQPDVAQRLAQGGAHLAHEYLQALRYRQDRAQSWDQWMARFDVIMLPTVPMVAPPLSMRSVSFSGGGTEDVRSVLTRFTSPFNFLGLPALTIPWGLFQGLPVGLQLVGRRGEDAKVLALGEAIQEAFPQSLPIAPELI